MGLKWGRMGEIPAPLLLWEEGRKRKPDDADQSGLRDEDAS